MKCFFLHSLLFILLCYHSNGWSQSSDAVSYNNVTLDTSQQLVMLSIKTTESFIVGANRYVLHIGGKTFKQSMHPNGRLDEIMFLITLSAYQAIKKEAEMVLVYGYYHSNALQDGEDDQVNGYTGKHWKLGAFQPTEFNHSSTQK